MFHVGVCLGVCSFTVFVFVFCLSLYSPVMFGWWSLLFLSLSSPCRVSSPASVSVQHFLFLSVFSSTVWFGPSSPLYVCFFCLVFILLFLCVCFCLFLYLSCFRWLCIYKCLLFYISLCLFLLSVFILLFISMFVTLCLYLRPSSLSRCDCFWLSLYHPPLPFSLRSSSCFGFSFSFTVASAACAYLPPPYSSLLTRQCSSQTVPAAAASNSISAPAKPGW